ncbi:MAG TPA: hypothetical protein EYG94_06500 [Campylobacterales bacterium]|nr:hypothetical protein [Campylobacterales bacterium]
MLDKLREISHSVWEPVGEMMSTIFAVSDIWFPIISYIVITIASLFLLKLILDKTVSTASSLTLGFIWSFVKKLIIYTVIIAVVAFIVISLYFYVESLYGEYQEESIQTEKREQSVDYLLL